MGDACVVILGCRDLNPNEVTNQELPVGGVSVGFRVLAKLLDFRTVADKWVGDVVNFVFNYLSIGRGITIRSGVTGLVSRLYIHMMLEFIGTAWSVGGYLWK